MKASQGNVVKLNFEVRDDAGEVLDSSKGREPLEYLHGYNNIIPGLERALEGMEAGSRSEVTLPPAEAYGERDADAVFSVPVNRFPEGADIQPGAMVGAQTPDGPVTMTVLGVTEDAVLVDANHPLAGKTLYFDVEILEVRPATEDEKADGRPAGETVV